MPDTQSQPQTQLTWKETIDHTVGSVLKYFHTLTNDETSTFLMNGEDPTLDFSEVRKALIESDRFPKYYAVRDNIIINLGFSIDSKALRIERNDHDFVGRYCRLLVKP